MNRPKSVSLKVLEGDRSRRLGPSFNPWPVAVPPISPPSSSSPAVVPPKLSPPKSLSREAKKIWRLLAKDLCSAQVVDRYLIESLVVAVERARQADEETAILMAQCRQYPEDSYLMKRLTSFNVISRKNWDYVHRVAQDFGLSPAARARLGTMQVVESGPSDLQQAIM